MAMTMMIAVSTHANLWCKTYAIYATKEASFSKRNVLISCLGNMKCSAFLKNIYICGVIICLLSAGSRVLMKLGKAQFELQKLVDTYVSY